MAGLGGVFAPENRDRTVAALLASQGGARSAAGQRDAVRKRLAEADKKLRRLQEAIAAGVDPAALVGATNAAQAERVATQAQLDHGSTPDALDRAEVYAMVDSLSEIGRDLDQANLNRLQDWYEALRLEMIYDANGQADMPLFHVLDLNAITYDTADGPQLEANWTFAGAHLTEEEVGELAQMWFAALEAIATCAGAV